MRTAVISDIHANLEALTAVLERTKALKADELVCLGDMVGYNADPNETLGILRSEKALCVLGNHDACAAGLEEPDDFNPLARAAVFWTRDRLTEKNRQFLAELPRERRVRDFFAFHGSVHDTDRYILYREDAVHNFRLLAGLPNSPLLGFFGHTHLMTALIEQQGTISTIAVTEELELAPGKRYLINPGSVGQPRDGNPDSSYVVLDLDAGDVEFRRVRYDIGRTQQLMREQGLPSWLAERLSHGR
jgi:predicted phosphodiesterase